MAVGLNIWLRADERFVKWTLDREGATYFCSVLNSIFHGRVFVELPITLDIPC